ncbi:MAG: PAS domain S-box protein, partial [Planctomycetota bacterium]
MPVDAPTPDPPLPDAEHADAISPQLPVSFEAIFDSILDGISILSTDYTILWVNDTMRRWYQADTPIVGRKCFEVYHSRDRLCEICPTQEALATGQSAKELVPKCAADGRQVGWLDLYSFPLKDRKTGEIRGIIEYVRDVTDRCTAEDALQHAYSEMEEQVRRRTEELEEANRRLADSAAFQAVLARIRGALPALRDQELWELCLGTIVEEYGLCIAWYGQFDGREVRPIFSRGRADHYLDALVLRIAPVTRPDADCAMSRAILEKRPFGYADLANDEGFRAWRDYALELGYASNLALPVIIDGEMEGGVMVYADIPHAFDGARTNQMRLLVEEACQMLSERRRQRRTDTALRDSEERYRALVESAGEAIFSIDETGVFLFANRTAARQAGMDVDELVGLTLWEVFPEPVADRHAARIREVLDHDRGWLGEAPSVLQGRDRWFRTSIEPLRTGQGPRAVLLVARDITDQKVAEEALRQSEQRFRAVAESARDMIFTKDTDLRYSLVNPALERMLNLPASEILGRTAADLMPPDEAHRIERTDRRVLAGEEMSAIADLTLNHVTRTLHICEVPLHDAGGAVSGVCGIVRDITEHRRALEALQESEEKYRAVVENARDGIAVVQDWKLRYANPKVAELTGRRLDDLWEHPFLDLLHPDAREEVAERHRRRLAGEAVEALYEVRLRHPDGEDGPTVEISIAPFQYDGRDALLVFLHDIRARRQAEAALRENEEKYRSLVENAGDGIAIIQDGAIRYANPQV